MNQNKILLVEKQENIREMICFSLESEFSFFVVRCRSVDEALSYLELNNDIDGVICDGNEDHGVPYDLFCKVVALNPEIPFISTDADSIGTWTPVAGVGLAGKVRRTEVIEKLNSLLKRVFLVDEGAPTEEFTAVSLSSLRFVNGIHEDIYIRLKTGRLLKLFTADHPFGLDDIERYQQKGVHQFYFNRQALHWIRNKIDQGIFILLASPNASLSLEQRKSIDDESNIDYESLSKPFKMEREFIKVIHRRQTEIANNFKEMRQFKDFIKALKVDRDDALYLKNRIGLVSNISCSLLRQLEWGSDAAYDKMIYVSFIHDVALFQHPALARYETLLELEVLSDLTPAQIELIKNHTIEAEKLIEGDSRAPQEASLIVRQHHEIPDRKGFPDALQVQRITPFAAVLCISISLAQFILENPEWSFPLFEKKYANRYRGAIYSKIMQALRVLFGMKPIV